MNDNEYIFQMQLGRYFQLACKNFFPCTQQKHVSRRFRLAQPIRAYKIRRRVTKQQNLLDRIPSWTWPDVKPEIRLVSLCNTTSDVFAGRNGGRKLYLPRWIKSVKFSIILSTRRKAFKFQRFHFKVAVGLKLTRKCNSHFSRSYQVK